MKPTKCPFCGKRMGIVCDCGSYKVNNEGEKI